MSERGSVDLSILVPVGPRHADVESIYAEYEAGMIALGRTHEFIFVLDGRYDDVTEGLKRLIARGEPIKVVSLTRLYGESTALMAGFEHAAGDRVVTLPAYHQIEGGEIGLLVSALDTCDIAIGRRWPRAGGMFERARRGLFHGLLSWVTGVHYRDLGCSARAMTRRVLEEIQLYGDQHRFLAVLADRQGFRVREVDVRQSPKDRFEGAYGPRTYTRSVLDLFAVFFLARFTKRPLRFFGMVGVSTFGIGALLTLVLVAQRLFFDQRLGDRPALLLSTLLVVLGLQLFALGLLGELIIFTHARGMKDYQVDKIIQFDGKSA